MIRRTLTWLAVGAALGIIGTMWLGPGLIRWRLQGLGGTSVCAGDVLSATEFLVKLQVGVGAATGVLAAVLSHLIVRRRAKPATPEPTPNQTAPR